MMPFPKDFSLNEWFVLIILILSFMLIQLLPKRLPVSISILVMMFSITSARLYDHLLSSPKIDLYGMMDSGKYEFFDLILYIMYAPFGYFFVYLYEKLHVKGYWIIVYIFIWSSFGTFFEWIAVKCGVFVHKEWELKYSFTVYVFTQAIGLLIYGFLRKQHHISKQENIR